MDVENLCHPEPDCDCCGWQGDGVGWYEQAQYWLCPECLREWLDWEARLEEQRVRVARAS